MNNQNGTTTQEEIMTSLKSRTLAKARQMTEPEPPREVVLNVLERLLLLQILPPQGSLTTIRIVRELRERLSFSEDEQTGLNFKYDGPQIQWDPTASYEVPVPIGPVAQQLIVESLEKLDETGQVTEQYLPLFDKFGVGVED